MSSQTSSASSLLRRSELHRVYFHRNKSASVSPGGGAVRGLDSESRKARRPVKTPSRGSSPLTKTNFSYVRLTACCIVPYLERRCGGRAIVIVETKVSLDAATVDVMIAGIPIPTTPSHYTPWLTSMTSSHHRTARHRHQYSTIPFKMSLTASVDVPAHQIHGVRVDGVNQNLSLPSPLLSARLHLLQPRQEDSRNSINPTPSNQNSNHPLRSHRRLSMQAIPFRLGHQYNCIAHH